MFPRIIIAERFYHAQLKNTLQKISIRTISYYRGKISTLSAWPVWGFPSPKIQFIPNWKNMKLF